MIRLVNNRFFTLIEAILLAIFAVSTLLFQDVFNILFGIALAVYTFIFVFTKVIQYRGMVQLIAVIEFFIMVTMIVFVFAKDRFNITLDIINIAIGLAMWIRATTEIMHSFFGQGQGREAKKQFNGWKLFAYILLLTLGTFIATSGIVNDELLRYLVVGISIAATIIMSVLTYTNFVDYRATHPKAPKPAKVKKGDTDVKELDAAADAEAEDEVKPESSKQKALKKGSTKALPAAKAKEDNNDTDDVIEVTSTPADDEE